MRTDFQQFYVAPDKVSKDSFVLDGDEYRHVIKVMRKQVGDDIAAIDGCGHLYGGVIRSIEKNIAVVAIKSVAENVGEPDLKLTIAQAVPKGQHFDLVVEKGTEIGVSVFQPMTTARSIVQPDSRVERWQHKALAAAKQCGRTICPVVEKPLPFSQVIKQKGFDAAFIAHPDENAADSNIVEVLRDITKAIVFIGPEGGFTNEEVQMAQNAGAQTLNLGARRLRSETAALVAATKILTFAGELGH